MRWFSFYKRLSAYFDGEAPLSARDARRLERDPKAQQYLGTWRGYREGVRAVRGKPEIPEEQFSTFFAGIRARIEEENAPAPARASYRFQWATALSAAAATLVVGFFMSVSGGKTPEKAARYETFQTARVANDVYRPPAAGAAPPQAPAASQPEGAIPLSDVEYADTDINGASVDVYDNEDTGTTVWINSPGSAL